jgi:hypothetical protein
MIISAYRTPQGIHDETFAELAARALEDYSDDVLRKLVDPKEGIITESRFLPSIAEMKDYCQTVIQSRYVPPVQYLPPKEAYIPPEERARVVKRFEELSKHLASLKTVNDETPKTPPTDSPEFDEYFRSKLKGLQEAIREAEEGEWMHLLMEGSLEKKTAL